MKKKILQVLALTLTAVMLFVLIPAPSASAADASSICKLLDSYSAKSDSLVFNLTENSRFYVVSDAAPSGDLLQTVQLIQQQFAADGYGGAIVWGPESWAKDGDVVLFVDSSAGIAAEGYQLDVAPKAIIKASDVDGLLYGGNMMLKILRNCGSTSIKGFEAADAPDTKERTVQLDVARKYFTKEWVCNFIKEASWMGYNTISLHFSEDGGFRADFWDPAYYKSDEGFQPENDFTWLCGAHAQSWVKEPYLTKYNNMPDKDKYLETSELIEIINVAKQYHMEIIPNFDSPSHMDYLTWKYEQHYNELLDKGEDFTFKYNGVVFYAKKSSPAGCINYNGTAGASSPIWPDYTTMELRDEQADYTRGKNAMAFVKSIYEDIADFFRVYAGSTKFGVGADEVNLTAAKYAWNYSYFPSFMNELNALLKGKGYTMRMYNDFIRSDYLSQFDDDIEIQYWVSPFNPSDGGVDRYDDGTVKPIMTVQQMVADGRTLYNCIQTNCYFVLRVTAGAQESNDTTDARSADCRSWTFYHSDEDSIYNEWYPADISEHGDYSEDVPDVPSDQLGGAYFLIWNDYASVATESEVWNGINSDGKWNVIDRMWSNTIKMWNCNINLPANEQGVVTYDQYKALREKFGYFPGYTSCSAASNLPAAETNITQAYLADHTPLNQALANKLPAEGYTSESYANYEAAYNEAADLNADHGATEAQISAAIANLENAAANLVPVTMTVTVIYKTNVNGEVQTIKTETYDVNSENYSIYIAPVNGYAFVKCQGASYTATASGDGSGTIRGNIRAPEVTLWYESILDMTRRDYLLENPVEEGTISYTAESWLAYQTAYDALKNYETTAATTQADVDALVRAVELAQSQLVAESAAGTGIIRIEKLTNVACLGKQVGLRITTTPDVTDLTITDITGGISVDETLTICVGKVQTLNSGETVKIWLVHFPADVIGQFTYTLTAGSETENFDITVQ